MNKALVLQSISGIAKIKNLKSKKIILAELKGKLLNEKINVLPGDYVDYFSEGEINIITNVLPRKNSLIRPRIANIDYLVIIQSFKEPELTITMINKYILYFQSQMIDDIILFFTKFDLLNEQEKLNALQIINHFRDDHFLVFTNNDIDDFMNFLNHKNEKIICFTGQSGVGKSTLLNKINHNFNIKTNEISKALNRGKHTTTATLLHEYNNLYLVDTPGFSSVNIDIDPLQLATGYRDFREYALKCKFNNCLHKTENDCEVKKMVDQNMISKERYDDYLSFLNSLKSKFKF
ncbi:MAG: ribosome small subunit-dependent GTPase A [Mycoplasmoidaceae bacterium]